MALKTPTDRNYLIFGFPMALSALYTAAKNTTQFEAATPFSAVPASIRLLSQQAPLFTVPVFL